MEKQIPTIEVDIEGEKVLLYQWLTQEEEDKLNAIMIGDIEVDPSQVKKESLKVKISMTKLSEVNSSLVKFMCKSHTWEIVNQWNPSKRALLLKEIESIRSKN